MKKVLLTGATGFIGRQCLPALLSEGYEVHAVSSRSQEESFPGVRWHLADLLDGGQVLALMKRVQPTHLLHLAWYVAPGLYWTALENFHWVKASLDLLHAFSQCGGHRVVMAGTCAEYDWEYGYCSERVTPLSPATPYGVCKHSLHMMLEAFARQAGLSAAWGRIFFPFGPHEYPERLVASVIRSALQGKPARCSHGNQIRDFIYVKDVAGAFAALTESAVIGPVNIASGSPVLLKDVIHKIAVQLDRADLIQLGAVPAPAGEPPALVASVSRLQDEVGWRPKYDLDAAIEETIEWWKRRYFDLANSGQGR
jgi:nucleoside-diphosphate-sugar epimerase